MPWLLPAPADFRAQLKQSPHDVATLRRLSHHALEVGQLGKLSQAIDGCRDTIRATGSYAELRLGVISSHTTNYIAASLPATGLRHGLLLSCVGHDYGQVAQSVFDPGSPMVDRVDTVLLALDARMLGLDRAHLSEGAAREAVEGAIGTVTGLANGIRANLRANTVFTTLPAPVEALFGEVDRTIPGTPRALAEAFNAMLVDVVAPGDLIVDVAQVAAMVGLVNWHDARSWHASKLPFALDLTPLYADHVCRVLAAMRGKSRKCLVLDLDNTLWGGVIGDDGLEAIQIGQGSAVAEAHLAVQAHVLALRERGIILAVCSKNDEANALLPFSEHPEMLLRRDHIAVFVANWSDKAGNLREIAAALNIGTDALVFLDDNPAERDIVRRELPEVAVPEVGEDPADYRTILSGAGYFEALAFSEEDRRRADYYQANSARRVAQASLTNMADYLRSLDMTASFAPFDAIGRSRIAQLVNKSNQFNLTTRRYTDADIAAIEADAGKFTLQVRLADRFGDNGMISVVIFDRCGDVWDCDTWLMSCRVLGRGVEQAVLAHVAEAARASGAARLTGSYIPTPKNGLVETHFEKLGFAEVSRTADGTTRWQLDLASFVAPDLPIAIDGRVN